MRTASGRDIDNLLAYVRNPFSRPEDDRKIYMTSKEADVFAMQIGELFGFSPHSCSDEFDRHAGCVATLYVGSNHQTYELIIVPSSND